MTTPSYSGTNNFDDPLVQPWYIEGWTSQGVNQDTIQAVTGLLTAPAPLPVNLVYAVVTGMYIDMDSNPLSGFLTFQLSESFSVVSNGTTYRMPARYAGRDNTDLALSMNNFGTGKVYIRRGLMSVTLMTTSNPAITTDSGNPLTYHVVEHFLGGQQFDITISDAEVSPVDLRSLVVPGSITPYDYDPADPTANEGFSPSAPSMVVVPGIIDGGTA